MNDTVLVTGGAGFIGGTLVRRWLAEYPALKLVNLDRLTYAGNLDSLSEVLDSPRHTFVQGDIGDAALVASLLDQHRPRAIVHLAAESHVDRSIDGPAVFVDTNVRGTCILLEAACRYWQALDAEARVAFRFLHVSTDEVFGSLAPAEIAREGAAFAPNSPYAASKAAADHFVRAYHQTFGLPTLVTNASNNFGPYQFPEKLIPLMIRNAVAGRPLPIYGDGQQVRDWLFVEDHCRGLKLVLERGTPGRTYNLGADCLRTNLALVETLCELVDTELPGLAHRPCRNLIRFVTDRPGHDRRYALNTEKIRQLGWQPNQDFLTALRSTVRWYLNHPDWIERVTNGNYRFERLGLRSESASESTSAPITS